MSAAASAAHPRVATKGWVRVPSSLIENQAVFTRAEMALALIVLRRAGGSDNVAVSISDENWTSWTGLGARLKEYAVAGLKQKCLQVSGRGDGARYSFAQSKWNTFVRHAGRSRPRTVGRKAGVTAKPGAKVHPECRERGCAMLQGASGCELIEFPNAQPVAQSGGELGDDHLGVPPTYQGIETPSGSTSAVQPVARSDPFPGSETPWPLALQELRKYFPLVEPGFVQKLAASVQREFKTVTDAELAQAVAVAHAYKHHYQKSEGLFLATVPSALRLLRRSPLSATRRNTRAAAEMLTDNFEKLAQLLEGQERF